MKKTIGLVIASLAMSTTAAFAGLTLSGDPNIYSARTVKVKCLDSNGKVLADRNAIVNQNVSWFIVKGSFLGGQNEGHCIFTYTPTGANMGEGDISILNDLSKGKVSGVQPGIGYNVVVTPDQNNYYTDVTISLA